MAKATVLAVCRSDEHSFSKKPCDQIRLIEGLGIENDTHAGVTVQHLSRLKREAHMPNLRQVHLIHAELFDELGAKGFVVKPGDIGENVTTEGVDLLGLPRGTRLHLGAEAVVEITGLRNPCRQLDDFQKGLMAAVLEKDTAGNLIRKAGVMGVVIAGGAVKPGDTITVELPAGPHQALAPV